MPHESPESVAAEGEAIFRRGSVRPISQENGELCYHVGTSPAQLVTLRAQGAPACTCGASGENACVHIAAASLRAEEDGSLRLLRQTRELTLGQDMLSALSRAMPGGESVRITPCVRLFDDGRVGFGLALGQERPYAVRSVTDLLSCYAYGEPLTLSSRFTYQPRSMRFSKDDEALLAMLLSHIPPRPLDEENEDDEERAFRPPVEGRFVPLSGAFCKACCGFLRRGPSC